MAIWKNRLCCRHHFVFGSVSWIWKSEYFRRVLAEQGFSYFVPMGEVKNNSTSPLLVAFKDITAWTCSRYRTSVLSPLQEFVSIIRTIEPCARIFLESTKFCYREPGFLTVFIDKSTNFLRLRRVLVLQPLL